MTCMAACWGLCSCAQSLESADAATMCSQILISACLFNCLSVRLHVLPSVCLAIRLSACLPADLPDLCISQKVCIRYTYRYALY